MYFIPVMPKLNFQHHFSSPNCRMIDLPEIFLICRSAAQETFFFILNNLPSISYSRIFFSQTENAEKCLSAQNLGKQTVWNVTKWVCGWVQWGWEQELRPWDDLSGWVFVSSVIPDKWQNYPMCWHVERAGPLSTPISRRWITHTQPFITTAAEQHSSPSKHTHTDTELYSKESKVALQYTPQCCYTKPTSIHLCLFCYDKPSEAFSPHWWKVSSDWILGWHNS